MKNRHIIRIVLSAAVLLALSSCHKDEGKPEDGNGNNAAGYNERDWDWNDSSKTGGQDGFLIDTAWDGDTTIHF